MSLRGEELGNQLQGAFRRSVHRDMEALGSVGVERTGGSPWSQGISV